jgi:hypothetical protein
MLMGWGSMEQPLLDTSMIKVLFPFTDYVTLRRNQDYLGGRDQED